MQGTLHAKTAICISNLFIFVCDFSSKVTCAFLANKKQWRNSQKQLHFSSQKNDFIFHIFSEKDFKSTVVNLTLSSLHWGSLNITLTLSSPFHDLEMMHFRSITTFPLIFQECTFVGGTYIWLNSPKELYLPLYCSGNGFKGTVVNRELPSLYGGSLEFTLTVPLNQVFINKFAYSSFLYWDIFQ